MFFSSVVGVLHGRCCNSEAESSKGLKFEPPKTTKNTERLGLKFDTLGALEDLRKVLFLFDDSLDLKLPLFGGELLAIHRDLVNFVNKHFFENGTQFW